MRSFVLATAIVTFASACGARTAINAEICTEGRQIACACPGGFASIQVCLPGGVWGVCQCPAQASSSGGSVAWTVGQGGARAAATGGAYTGGRSGSGGVSGSGGRSTGSGGWTTGYGGSSSKNPDAAVGSGTQIAQGTSQLLDLFVGDSGIYVITTDAVVLYDRGGNEKMRVTAPRQISSAAFDGTQIVVADRAKLTTYDLGLSPLVSADLMETCVASVLVGGSRFVCGPANDWDRVFYTYDAKTGKLLATSKQYTYNGIPMRRVPGTDDFVTVTDNLSPSDFHLYSVLASGEVTYVNESPYHGDFSVTTTYAFDGAPPKHLITSAGLILKIYDTACSADANSFTSTCFVKDGALGTLSGSQYFLAMDSDATGVIFALVDPASSIGLSAPCSQGCILEKVDVGARSIVSQSIVHLGAARIVAFRNDPVGKTAVVGYIIGNGSSYYFASDPYPGYRVAVLPY